MNKSIITLGLWTLFWVHFLTPEPAEGSQVYENNLVEIHHDECLVQDDPESLNLVSSTKKFYLCLRGKATSDAAFFSDNSAHDQLVYSGKLYTGFHYGTLLSFHWEGRAGEIRNFNRNQLLNRDAETRHLFLQFGNPAIHRFRLTLGKRPLPFGNSFNDLPMPIVLLSNESLWLSPPISAVLTFDNQSDLVIDLGYAGTGNHFSQKIQVASPRESSVGLRLMWDFAALDGSRIIASMMEGADHNRRFNLGFVNVTPRGDLGAFEWIRDYPQIGVKREIIQLFRVSFSGAQDSKRRWIIQYDDESQKFRMGSIVYQHKILPALGAVFGISFQKTESKDERSRWITTMGMEARL